MIVKNNRFSRYNDGVVRLYREKERRNSFSAKQNVESVDNMTFIAKLDYEECSKREQDLEFANQNDFSLSLKIKTRFIKGIDNKCKAVINDYLYDVSYIDTNRVEMWLYLEGIRQL